MLRKTHFPYEFSFATTFGARFPSFNFSAFHFSNVYRDFQGKSENQHAVAYVFSQIKEITCSCSKITPFTGSHEINLNLQVNFDF